MPQHNLTRQEATTRAALVSVTSYEITLVLDGAGDHFRSVTTVRFRGEEGASTFIDAITHSVHSVVLNGRELDPDEVVSPGRIALPGLAQDNELVVDAEFLYMNTGEGLHRFVDPVDDETYLYTQFEVPDARRVFAVFEQPDLKASFSFTIVAPAHWTVVSNSPSPEPEDAAAVLAGLGLDGEAKDTPGTDLRVWAFAPTPRISSYITAIIAGPYASVRSSLDSSDGEEVPLGVFCRASLLTHLDAEEIFDITRKGFAFYEELFGTPYPFEKYDQLFVPEFNAGAMENAGAVTFLENYVFRSRPTEAMVERRAVTILHELAHMWFGDLVTMKWWNDLWLNESFAEFMSTLATAETTRFTDAWTTFATLEKSWAYRQDQLPSTHPIVAPIEDLQDVEVNFDGITYAKGASVLKQLVAWVGRDAFFAGLRAYFEKHAWSNTVLADLLSELADASGRDLRAWSALWLEESGVTLIRPEITRGEQSIESLALLQEPFVLDGRPVPSLRPHRVGLGFYRVHDSSVRRVAFLEVDLDAERAEVPLDAAARSADLVVVNDADLSYTKVRFDAQSFDLATAHLGGFEDSLTQLVVLSTVWDMVRDGELPATAYIDMLLEHLPAVTHSTGLLVQFRQLTTAIEAYLPAADRPAVRTRVAARLWDLLTEVPAGSDQQLQFFQAFTRHAADADQHLRLTEILDSGRTPFAGLTVDTDLRWEILIALAAAGIADEARISAVLADDDTAAGRRQAATARAAAADPAVKTRAFHELVGDTAAPNAMVAAVARGFAMGLERPDGALVSPAGDLSAFDTEYFDRVAGWWELRTLEIAQTLTLALFPPASPQVVSAAREWLDAHPAAPKGLVRLMRENLDNAERALRCRAVSAG
ncbi:aminopeptidase N [Brevibacterium samyangense]|uniref:Aminopeptidase N n=1 Tax=Brevibacterium samyangense TaxID=366888 RepID=A0ABN2TA70_9MICO